MPKRGRKASPAPPSKKEHHHQQEQGDSLATNESSKKIKRNPFSIGGSGDQHETEQQQLLQAQLLLEHVLVFSDAQKRGKGGGAGVGEHGVCGDDSGCDHHHHHVKLIESIQFLIDFIEQQESSSCNTAAASASRCQGNEKSATATTSSILSASDISQLLLPWAVQRVLHIRPPVSRDATAEKIEEEKVDKAKEDEDDLFVLVWKALRVTLSSLLYDNTNNDSSSNNPMKTAKSLPTASMVLSQSDLFKLVPRIAQMASSSCINTSSTAESSSSSSSSSSLQDSSASAGAVYKLLLATRLFNPTMDMACKSVFCPLVSKLSLVQQPLFSILLGTRTNHDDMAISSSSSTTTTTTARNVDEDCSILMATLEWMQSILKSGRGNPKTTFHLVSTRAVLVAFSRAYFYLHLHDVEKQMQRQQQQQPPPSQSSSKILWMSEIPLFEAEYEDNSSSPTKPHARELVRTILYDALFHASSHMDGYRSLLLSKRKKTKIVKGSGGGDASEVATVKQSAKSSFSCYQQDLLDFITDTLNVTDSHQEERLKQRGRGGGDDDDTVTAAASTCTSQKEGAFIIPILYRGFLLESAKWHQQNRAGGGGNNTATASSSGGGGKRPFKQQQDDSAVAPLTTIQFAMFVEMATPLRELAFQDDSHCNDNTLSLVALRALRETTNLLLVHDAYIPAEDDAQRSQTVFLDEIAVQLLGRAAAVVVENESRNNDSGGGVEWLSECIHLLHTLVQLNHLLLHERLVQVMAIAFQSNNARLQPQIANFFAIFVDTYRKLRQQTHFFQSVLVALTQFEQEQKHVQIFVLAHLLNDSQSLASSVAFLVQDIPITQVREIFEAIEQWILERVDLVKSNKRPEAGPSSEALDVVVQLTILSARNVRVDSSRVKEVATVVKKFAETAVTALVEQDEDEHQVRAALSLCGWFIHLQSRCAFWLGRGAQLLIPTKIQDYMTRTVAKATGDRGLCLTGAVYDNVLFLVSHRLEQLSSLIHDEQIAELLRGSPSTRVSEYSSEARQLAAFMAQVAKSQTAVSRTSSRPRWVVIAVTLHSWAPFAEEQHIDWFLDWLFSVLALDPSSPSLPPDSLAYRDDLRGIDEEVEVANGLMLDASFHEIRQIAPRLRIAALCCSSKWISWSLADQKATTKALSVIADIHQYSKAKSDLVVDLEISHCKLEPLAINVMTTKLSRALRPILLVNGLPQPFSMSEGLSLSRVTLVLDQLCVALAKLDSALRNGTVPLISALRVLLARCLDVLSQDEFNVMSTTDPHWIKVCSHLVLSCNHIHCHENIASLDPQKAQQHQLLVVTGKLVSNIVSHSTSSSLAYLMSTLQPFLEKGDEGDEHDDDPSKNNRAATVRVALMRYILLGIETSHVKSGDCRSGTVETAWKLGWKTHSLFHTQLDVDRSGRGHCYLLVGDLLRLACKWQIPPDDKVHPKMSQVVIRHLSSHVTSISKGDNTNGKSIVEEQRAHDEALYYAVTCIVNTKPAADVSLSVLKEIIQVDWPHDLLDASFCHLVSDLDGKHLEAVLRRLLLLHRDDEQDDDGKPCTASSLSLATRLRFLDFIMLYGKKDSHVECISKFGRHVFLLALQALYKRHPGQSTRASLDCCCWTEGIIQSTKLLTELMKRRDLISLRERDLALVLAHVSAVLGPGGGGNELTTTTTTVYLTCIRLFSFLQQRFPKQLHTCAPSVISVMHSFLRHTMIVNVVEANTMITSQQQRLLDQDIFFRAQEFSRICELLISHREVYKKHIVSLVLAFVQYTSADKNDNSNNGTMSLTVREALVPAIHYLLDSFSVHETKTLNAQMDLRCKTTFRSIYQSYQKVHTYKGQ
jgi:Urb2/Npa2 family